MRREKTLAAIFRMQFQLTQVPPIEEATGLMISVIPADAGGPTAILDKKHKIIQGPVYETVELVQEIKTGRIRDKNYYFIVSTGSTESGFLGQVLVDFADLAEATKPRNLTLPLQTGAILHVTVQRMPEDYDLRSTEDAETRDEYSDRNGSLYPTESEASSEACCNERNGSVGEAETENNEMKMLERKPEVSEKEVEFLKQQVVEESKKGQQLSELTARLQEERDAIKTECEQLKSDFASAVQKETESLKISIEVIKKELQLERHLKDELKLQLQKTEDSNSEYSLALSDLTQNMDQKNTEISQLSSRIKALESEKMDLDEEKLLKQTIENLNSEIQVHKKEKEDILIDVMRLATDCENMEKERKQIYSILQQHQKEKMEMEQNYTEYLATVKQLKSRLETLEEDIKKQQLDYSESLTVNEELETQVKNLKKELENQAQLYEENLKTATEVKIEQEQRALHAEEAFSKARRDHANTVERLQQEFKQLSDEMLLQIEENEKSITEATDLQQKNGVLESLLQKAEEEHQKTRAEYERVVHELEELKQLLDKMSLKIEEKEKIAQISIAEAIDLRQKNEVLESCLQKAEEENQVTRTECYTTVHELQEQNKKICTKEYEDLERQLASVREEVEKLKQENVSMKSQVDLKNSKEVNLNLEVKKLRLKNGDLKNHLSQVELEKEDLKKEVAMLQESAQAKNINSSKPEGTGNSENNTDMDLRLVDDLKNQIELNTAQIKSLLTEVEYLKDRNRIMEEGLEEMHERYSEISLRFAEVEGERQQLIMALRNMKTGKKN